MYDQKNLDHSKYQKSFNIPNRLEGGDYQPINHSVQDYFKINFYLPLLGLLVNNISNWFFEKDLNIIYIYYYLYYLYFTIYILYYYYISYILQALYEVFVEESPSSGSVINSSITRIMEREEGF